MKAFNESECQKWWSQNQTIGADSKVTWPVPGMVHIDIAFPQKGHHFYGFSKFLAQSIATYPTDALLWVVNHFIWPSSENLHLYYRMRESYGIRSLLEDAPGHYFLNYESSDLVSFLQIGALFGWDMYIGTPNKGNSAKLSHDEYVEFAVTDESEAKRILELATIYGLKATLGAANQAL